MLNPWGGDEECIHNYHLGETGVDERISKWIVKEQDVRKPMEFKWVRTGSRGGLL
jgi:hypothetical protein